MVGLKAEKWRVREGMRARRRKDWVGVESMHPICMVHVDIGRRTSKKTTKVEKEYYLCLFSNMHVNGGLIFIEFGTIQSLVY